MFLTNGTLFDYCGGILFNSIFLRTSAKNEAKTARKRKKSATFGVFLCGKSDKKAGKSCTKVSKKKHDFGRFWQELSVYKYNEIFSIHPRKVAKMRAGLV